MKQYVVYYLIIFFFNGLLNTSLFAQENDRESKEEETFQRYDSLEREMLLARKPLLAFSYNNLKAMNGSHGSVFGFTSVTYRPNGIPYLVSNTEPLIDVGIGWGLKMFLGRLFYFWSFDYGQVSWLMPPQGVVESVKLASSNMDIDLGYAVWKQEDILLSPCVNIGFSRYTFESNRTNTLYTHLGGAVDMSCFLPLAASPFQSLEERKLGVKEIIEAMISVRLGYSQHFMNSFSIPAHQEFSIRLMLGIGTHKFVDELYQ
jgi:hypothetical protein